MNLYYMGYKRYKKMTVQQLTNKVLNKENVLIFDVRNESDFHDWKVEEENFEYLKRSLF
jgi:rhodanese-related sulfurtransferase